MTGDKLGSLPQYKSDVYKNNQRDRCTHFLVHSEKTYHWASFFLKQAHRYQLELPHANFCKIICSLHKDEKARIQVSKTLILQIITNDSMANSRLLKIESLAIPMLLNSPNQNE